MERAQPTDQTHVQKSHGGQSSPSVSTGFKPCDVVLLHFVRNW